jgi:hypothetical protein
LETLFALAQRLLGLAPAGDVIGDTVEEGGISRFVPNQFSRFGSRNAHFAVGTHHSALERVEIQVLDGLEGRLLESLPVVRVDKMFEQLLHVLGGVLVANSQESAHLIRPLHPVRLEIPRPVAHPGQCLSFFQIGLGFAQFLFGRLCSVRSTWVPITRQGRPSGVQVMTFPRSRIHFHSPCLFRNRYSHW